MGRNVALPQGDIYPNGVPVGVINPLAQATAHIPGTFFKKSPGFESMRPGKHRLQKSFHGHGIHFTPHRFAQDMGAAGLPILVDTETAVHHADIAELPGSERLDDEGKTTRQEDRVLLAETGDMPTATESIAERHRHSVDLDGVRNLPSETKRFVRGVWLNPVDFLSDEVKKTPVKAVVMAGGITAIVYVIARDFERSYNRRKRRAGLAAAPAAAVETVGSTAATVVETPAKVVEKVADAVSQTAEAVADAVSGTTDAVADTTN